MRDIHPSKRGWIRPEVSAVRVKKETCVVRRQGGGMGWRWSLAQSSGIVPVAVETTAFAVPIASLYIQKSHLFCISLGGV